jgi:hypothetical protein
VKTKSAMYIVLPVLVFVPSVVNLLVPLYNREMPDLFGVPFFYWFQTIWLVVCSGFYLAFAHLMSGVDGKDGTTGAGAAESGVHRFN